MMGDRLAIAHNLLTGSGSILVSIDDNELQSLKGLMDSLFLASSFIATVIWQKVYAPKNTARHFSEDHDYILTYCRDVSKWKQNLLPRTAEADAHYGNPDNDSRGKWRADGMSARNYYSKGLYEITSPSGRVFVPPKGRYWIVAKEKFLELDRDNRIWWGQDGNNMPSLKRFLSEVKQGIVPQSLWLYGDVGHTQEAKKELLSIVEFQKTEDVLNTVKPTRLICRILEVATDPTDNNLIIDFFAGSGTTGDAVIRKNRSGLPPLCSWP
jgi:adenine-specific DNA-methyltransferase